MARARLLSCVGKCVTCKETFDYDVLIDVDEWEVQQFCSQTCWDMYHLNEEEVGGVSIEDYKVDEEGRNLDEVKRTKE